MKALVTQREMGIIRDFEHPDPLLSDDDLNLFKEGKHYTIYEKFGCHPMTINGAPGALFAVWAPNAKRVSVVGDLTHGMDKNIPCGSGRNGEYGNCLFRE